MHRSQVRDQLYLFHVFHTILDVPLLKFILSVNQTKKLKLESEAL